MAMSMLPVQTAVNSAIIASQNSNHSHSSEPISDNPVVNNILGWCFVGMVITLFILMILILVIIIKDMFFDKY